MVSVSGHRPHNREKARGDNTMSAQDRVTVIDGNTGKAEIHSFQETMGRDDLTSDQFARLEAHVDNHHAADWGAFENCHVPEGLILDGTVE
jgi:hypothetical protein